MKKILTITAIMILCSLLFAIPCEASSELGWSNIKNTVDGFVGKAEGKEIGFDSADAVKSLASILVTIGVIIVLAGILIIGIKYMMVSPNEAAKLKSRLVGLVIAGIVIIGAYGIWLLAGNAFTNIAPTYNMVVNTSMNPTPTPTPTPTATTTVTPTPTPVKDLGGTYTSSFTVEEAGAYKGQKIEYWTSIPKASTVGTYEKVPLIIYLHGRYEGASLSNVTSAGLPSYILNNSVTPNAMVVAPRFANSTKQWTMPAVEVYATVKHIIAEAKEKGITIDENNISITGFSIGGAGALDAIKTYPNLFHKAVLISPQDNPGDLSQIKCETKVYFETNESKKYSTNWKNATGNGQWSNITFEMPSGYGNHGSIQKIYLPSNSSVIEWMTK